MLALCLKLRENLNLCAVTNDIFTREDGMQVVHYCYIDMEIYCIINPITFLYRGVSDQKWCSSGGQNPCRGDGCKWSLLLCYNNFISFKVRLKHVNDLTNDS